MIGTFFSNRDSLELPKLLREMDGQDNLNKFVAEKDHANNAKNIEKMLNAHS